MINKDQFTSDIHLTDPKDHPTDTVSGISWAPGLTFPSIIATSSWDSYIRIYDIDLKGKTMSLRTRFDVKSPCLSVSWFEDMSKVFTGTISGRVKGFDLESGKEFEVGKHEGIVKDVYWPKGNKTLCSVSADKTVKFWDLRQKGHVGEIKLVYKPFCSDLNKEKLAIGLSEQKFTLIDIQQLQQEPSYKASPLGDNDPLSAMQFWANGRGVVFGSVGGRCNSSEIFDFDQAKPENRMTWRAHKVDGNSLKVEPDRVYPVNGILVSKVRPREWTGTCGRERNIVFWDAGEKQKICEKKMSEPVTCAKMTRDADLLAFATGNDWARGISEHMTKKTEIHVCTVERKQLSYPSNK